MIAENMIIALNAVWPLFFYLILGKICVKGGICREDFMAGINRLVFYILLPFTLFRNIYSLKGMELELAGGFAFSFISLIALFLILMAVVPLFEKDGRRSGVIVQALFRSNVIFYAIPLTESICGQEGAAMASLIVAFLTPFYNILSVIALEHFNGKKAGIRRTLLKVLTNPMIIGAILGGILMVMPFSLPEFFMTPVRNIANIATPMALFALGGTFHLERTGKEMRYIGGILFVKLIVIPAAILGIMMLFDLTTMERIIVFLLYATPTATASYAMAENMGGDAQLAGRLVVLGTAASIVTLFFWILLMKTAGII